MTQDSRIFYVYAFLRSSASNAGPKLSPYYIGKGQGQRARIVSTGAEHQGQRI